LQNLAIDRTPIPAIPKKEPKLTERSANAAKKKVEGEAAALLKQANQTKALSKEYIDKITARNKRFFDKIEKRIGDNPYKRQKFWFTVGANIMKKGNAFANLAEGLRIATNDLDLDRKEKDKLLNELDENRRDTANELDKTSKVDKLKALGLTTKQQQKLAGLEMAEVNAIIKAMEAGATLNTALAKLEKERRLANKIDKPKTSDFKNLDTMFANAFSSINPVFGIGKGKALNKKQLQQKSQIMTNAGDILSGQKRYRGETGANAANAYILNEARNYKP
jgi:hypothetical protein